MTTRLLITPAQLATLTYWAASGSSTDVIALSTANGNVHAAHGTRRITITPKGHGTTS